MKPDVEKLVFTELEEDVDGEYISFIAESPIGTYYIDCRKGEKEYSSYTTNAEIGSDVSLIKAIQRVNDYHRAIVLNCLSWE